MPLSIEKLRAALEAKRKGQALPPQPAHREMIAVAISMVRRAADTKTRDIRVEKVLEAIRTGGEKLKGQITQIRNRYEAELAITGDHEKAKKAIGELKKQLAAVTWSGRFSSRLNPAAEKLIQHSGLLCADLDELGADLESARKKLKASPHVWALFLSPSGDGLKAVFRVLPDASQHLASFRAVQKHVLDLTGVTIDESGKDRARLCFMSYDSELYVSETTTVIQPLAEPEKPKPTPNGVADPGHRRRIAVEQVGAVEWQSDTSGYLTCPGKYLHTTGDGERDCRIDLDAIPTVHCFHNSCRGILAAINHDLRSRIATAEYVRPAGRIEVQSNDNESVELAPRASYTPPSLDLLPPVLQEYVHAGAESLNVDVSFTLLPLLPSLGTTIGNARSVILKSGFIQPPTIWTADIGRSGSRKSPALEVGCFAILEHERELIRQNRQACELYREELDAYKRQPTKKRGAEPEAPEPLTCLVDNLTLEAVAERLEHNRRGVLVKKDELSHWFASFDQYTKAKGADVSQWLSLHTGVFFGLDRVTQKRHYRIPDPRVCITGGIQPQILRRALSEEFFERGLPARFLFAYPPVRKDRWSEATIPEDLRAAVLELFNELWLLHPESNESGSRPRLIRLDADARELFVEFYNRCGQSAVESDEHEEAAWCKLTGYGARLALVGQLARDPQSEIVTGDTMEAACSLAHWFGNETCRIYAELAETPGQRTQWELLEFIQRRGGAVYEREVMQSFTRLKNDKAGTERELTALLKAGRGKWEPVEHGGGPGRPTRKFRLLTLSTSTQFGVLRGETGNSVDVDAANTRKITPSEEPDTETETLVGDELEVARL